MALFNVGGNEYQSVKMLPETQLNVLARLAPLFTNYNTLRGILGVVLKRVDAKEAVEAGAPTSESDSSVAKEAVNEELLKALSGIFGAFSSMSDEDRHFVISRVLSLCTRRSGGSWSKVWNESAKRPMFDDMDLMVIMSIVVEVLKAELLPFFNSNALGLLAGLMR